LALGAILFIFLMASASPRPGLAQAGGSKAPEATAQSRQAPAASLTPIEKLAYLCNIGTLFAFFLVCVAVLVLRLTSPTLPRPFRCPLGKTVACLGAILSLGLMLSMPASSWWRLGAWLAIGLVIFFLYAWFSGRLRENGMQ